MQERKVKFTIGKEGGVAFEVLNGEGADCTKITKDIEVHLSQNGTMVDEGKKPEYYDGGGITDVFNSLD
ncbi:hypothetical protein TCA2_4435 [Paenibacillus sp. TCA20]|uniref:DUF2997 domain-containing protein n=1 Tax=Paenibacillus sp. TCA20 TaxID=1499968 RepID=UPI0004D86014|nr:DUF2997 domain-containing protein [Paenibacillus sp. TCA20]GAK41943.1 hypothetical protein TCA2_4435 [Paenibacillus sp. TCA20]